MKAKDALKILQVNRVTLYRYVKSGRLKATRKESGQYDYDDESVWKMAGWGPRARVLYMGSRGGGVPPGQWDEIYNDEGAGGLGLDSRSALVGILKEAMNHKIKTVGVRRLSDLTLDSADAVCTLLEALGCRVEILGEDKGTRDDMLNDLEYGLIDVAASNYEFKEEILEAANTINQLK